MKKILLFMAILLILPLILGCSGISSVTQPHDTLSNSSNESVQANTHIISNGRMIIDTFNLTGSVESTRMISNAS